MPFDSQPTLTGKLVHLRPLAAGDFDALFAVASDPLVWDQHPANDRWQETVFRRFFDDGLASGGALIVTDAATGAVIGSSRFDGYDAEKREIEIGWTFLSPSVWGAGHNGDMKRLMLEHAFQFVDRVNFYVGLENFRSQRAMEKIGGVRNGTAIKTLGLEHIIYTITADAFEPERLSPRSK